MSQNHSKSLTALVPMITRETPISSSSRMEASSRMPPPTSIWSSPRAAIAVMEAVLTGRPTLAPSRSTMCSQRAPSAWNCLAWAIGLSP